MLIVERASRCFAVAVLLLTVLLAACAPTANRQDAAQDATITSTLAAPSGVGEASTSAPQVTVLPTPQLKGTLTLEEALAQRRSVREFSDTPLTLTELGQLLWAAQGMTHPSGLRTAPSAGALYPLEVYAVTRQAAYHYLPRGHQMTMYIQGDVRSALHAAALRQDPVLKAPAVIVIAAVYARTAQKYGEERSPRYVHLEAGHAAQNVLLQAVALNLGAVPTGAFEDDKVQQALALPSDQQPLYLIPVGHPK
jgi:SagB-type dehydrogenase family enzyme